jgi:hypothetical protein
METVNYGPNKFYNTGPWFPSRPICGCHKITEITDDIFIGQQIEMSSQRLDLPSNFETYSAPQKVKFSEEKLDG